MTKINLKKPENDTSKRSKIELSIDNKKRICKKYI